MSSETTENHGGEVIALRGVGKCYRLFDKPQHRLLQAVFRGRQYHRNFWAVRGIDITMGRGETLGILGQNGSGKSTLLQIAAGTLTPTEGEVRVQGRVAALLELGSGFNPEFTGRENVFLNGSILGISRAEMEKRFDGIAAFADIGDFVDQPVKTYSSGMMVRLAFSVAISVDPDVLIVDEALSVGDAKFQARCVTRIRQMQESGVSILFVTHDMDACKRLCQRAYVLHKGEIVNHGPADEMTQWYLALLSAPEGTAAKDVKSAPVAAAVEKLEERSLFRHGDGNAEIVSVELIDAGGLRVEHADIDDTCTLRITVRFKTTLPTAIIGFSVRDRLGTDVIGTNTLQEHTEFPAVSPGDVVRVDFTMPLMIRPGAYSVTAAVAYGQHEMKYMDWVDNALVFTLGDRQPSRLVFGVCHPPTRVRLEKSAGQPGDWHSPRDAEPAVH